MKKLRKILLSLLIMFSVILPYTNSVSAASNLNVYIYAAINTKSSSSGSSGLGNSHAWIVIKNNTSSQVTVGKYKLNANASVTIGTWGNTTPTGLWYNKERSKITEFQNNNNTVYKTTSISTSKLSSINSIINNSDKWSLLNNCTHFAIRVWNATGSTQIGSCTTPSQLRDKIRNSGSYSTGTNNAAFRNDSTTVKKH